MNSLVLLILAVTAVAVHGDCGDYPDGHTMCLPEAPCSDIDGGICGAISDEDIEIVLDVHNQLRNKVAGGLEEDGTPGPQPYGGDIYELTWNDELAVVAQRWADQFIWEHDCDDCRNMADGSYVGQNMFLTSRSEDDLTISWKIATENWYSEVEFMNGSDISLGLPETGHYTQVVWGNTKEIGCGMYSGDMTCGDLVPSWSEYYCAVYVCNYAPPGNYIGELPYTDEQCPTTSDVYPFLCI